MYKSIIIESFLTTFFHVVGFVASLLAICLFFAIISFLIGLLFFAVKEIIYWIRFLFCI